MSFGLMENYADSMLGFGCNGQNPMFSYYYNPGPEYVCENDEMIGNGQRLIFNEHEDVSQFQQSDGHFMPYNSEGFGSDSDTTTLDSYHSEFEFETQFRECQLLVEEELSDMSSVSGMSSMSSMSSMEQSSSAHFDREQIQLQIRRNDELAHHLSPIRKLQEQMQSQQTRKNAENARRKFSLTNGIRPKQRQSNPNSPTSIKTTKLSVSVRRWQSEILAKLPFSQQKRDAMTGPPNVDAPLNREQVNASEWQAAMNGQFPAKPVPPQRRSSLQIPNQWSQMKEEYY